MVNPFEKRATEYLRDDEAFLAVVTPALSDSIPLASALFGPAGIGVGAAIYLGQKMFKEVPAQVDRFLRRQYAVTGPWNDPKVEKR